MNRALGWILAVGAIAALAYAGIATVRSHKLERAIAARDSVNGVLSAELEVQKQRVLVTEIRNQVLAGVADELSRRVANARPQLLGIAQRVSSISPDTLPNVAGDTTTYVLLQRKNDDRKYRVPQFIMDDTQMLLRSAFALDSAWRAERMSRLFLQDSLVPDLRRQLAIADSLIASQRIAIELRDKRANPRCGKKCWFTIGVLTTGGAAAVVDRVTQAVTP